MPLYSFRCSMCEYSWDDFKSMAEGSVPSPCPQCSHVANHLQIGTPSFSVVGGTRSSDSFENRFGRKMEEAKEMRRQHQEIFGKHEEYVQGPPGSHRIIDSERDVTIHGDVGSSKREQLDIIERKATS